MSSRERWTVYPLLFLTLAIALRTRMEGVEHDRHVRCGSLSIVNAEGKTLARLGNAHEQGRLEFYGPDGKIVLTTGAEPGGQGADLSIQNNAGNRQVRLGSNGKSGIVETCGPDGLPQVVMQATPRGGVLAAVRSDHKLVVPFGFAEMTPRAPQPQQPAQPPQPEQPAPGEPAPPESESQQPESTPQ